MVPINDARHIIDAYREMYDEHISVIFSALEDRRVTLIVSEIIVKPKRNGPD